MARAPDIRTGPATTPDPLDDPTAAKRSKSSPSLAGTVAYTPRIAADGAWRLAHVVASRARFGSDHAAVRVEAWTGKPGFSPELTAAMHELAALPGVIKWGLGHPEPGGRPSPPARWIAWALLPGNGSACRHRVREPWTAGRP
jgi:hypothetical protein